MAKAKTRKKKIVADSSVKSIDLFGRPNKGKRDVFLHAQKLYSEAMNAFCVLLLGNDEYYWEILNNSTHSSKLRKLEKNNRVKQLGSVLSQNAFDDVVNKLYNREKDIKTEINRFIKNEFTKNLATYYCMIMDKSKYDAIEMIADFLKQTIATYRKNQTSALKSKINYYRKLKRTLYVTPSEVFNSIKEEARFWYDSYSLEYKIPSFKRPYMRVDSRCCEVSKEIAAPFVLKISNPFVRGEKIEVPLDTTSVVTRRWLQYKPSNSFNIRLLDNGTLRVIGCVTKKTQREESDLYLGGDTGITDAIYLSDGESYGTFKDVIQFHIDVVEPSEAQKSILRNKIKKIKHFYQHHKDSLPEDIKQKLIDKMNNLNQMIQQNKVAKRNQNHYRNMLNKRIKDVINKVIEHIKGKNITIVLEKLDIKEFKASKKSNALRSTFARGQFQKRFLEQLAWHGINFVEVDPTYTSQVCPICFNLDKKNRNDKIFKCTCCGYTNDADYVASINISDRAVILDLKKIESDIPYSRNKRKISLKEYFTQKNAKYLKAS